MTKASKESAIKGMLEHITDELTPIDTEQRFRDMLDECYSFDSVGGPFAHMLPSRVLEKLDPVAFRCGVADYSNDDTYDINGEEYDRNEVDECRDKYIETLESELSDLVDDKGLTDDTEDDCDEWRELSNRIKECERYVF